MTNDIDRKLALDDFRWMITEYFHKKEIVPPIGVLNSVVSALSAPRVPVIPGLDEAINFFDKTDVKYSLGRVFNLEDSRRLASMFEAARAYAELQREV